MINFSIIIPHKNIPELLERCLTSIPVRDDVEVIVVDDVSDPEIAGGVDFPGLKRPNTRILFRDGSDGRSGPGAARNDGLALATGRWIVFVDADDLLSPEANALMDKYSDADADLVFMGNTYVDSDTLTPLGRDTPQARHIDNWVKKGSDYGLRYKMNAPWGKFIKRQLIEGHNIRFSEARFAEDMIFAVKSGHFARKFVCDPTILYIYTLREGALTSADNTRTLATMSIKFDEDLRVARFLRDNRVRIPSRLLSSWVEIWQSDQHRGKELQPLLAPFYPAIRIALVRLKLTFSKKKP
jgi:glycosyltransferase involved in cell wall biosynthesis